MAYTSAVSSAPARPMVPVMMSHHRSLPDGLRPAHADPRRGRSHDVGRNSFHSTVAELSGVSGIAARFHAAVEFTGLSSTAGVMSAAQVNQQLRQSKITGAVDANSAGSECRRRSGRFVLKLAGNGEDFLV